MSNLSTYCILEGVSFSNLVNFTGLEMEDTLSKGEFRIIRGVHVDGIFQTALLGRILPNNFCTLFLVSKEGENFSGTQHQHITYLDANFQAYKDKLGVNGFWICPTDERRVSLIETRLPLWEQRGNTPNSGEPLFVREV